MRILNKKSQQHSRQLFCKNGHNFENPKTYVRCLKRKNIVKAYKAKQTHTKTTLKSLRHDSFLTNQNSNFVSNMEAPSKNIHIVPPSPEESKDSEVPLPKRDLHHRYSEQLASEPLTPEAQNNDEIFKYLLKVAEDYKAKKIISSNGCTEKSRESLVRWIFDVAQQIKFHISTAFLAINFIDRAFGQIDFHANQLPLLGITTLFISAKLEQPIYPRLQHFVKIVSPKYGVTKQSVLKLEGSLFDKFCFNLNYCSPLSFIEYLFKRDKFNRGVEYIVKTAKQLIIDTQYKYCSASSLAWHSIEHVINSNDTKLQDNDLANQLCSMKAVWSFAKISLNLNL